MGKDKLPVYVLGFGGFALFIAFISGSVWYMANWAHSEVRPVGAVTSAREPVVSIRPAPQDFDSGSSGGAPGGGPRPTEPGVGSLPGRGSGNGSVDDGGGGPWRPRVAVVIDDWGYEWEMADAFIGFPETLTVAVLPFLPFSQTQAEQALAAGHEVILHMPMEAQNRAIDIGPGGIRTTMDDEEIASRVAAALSHIPGVSGLNNHMGSLATGDPRVMRTVLDVVAERELFFLDSYTAGTTVGPEVARAMAVPHAVNQVFLDHEDTEEHVRGQISRLIQLARQRGQAVGIGHVRPNTYRALIAMLPEMRQAGIEFVPVSSLLLRPVAVEGGIEWVTASSGIPLSRPLSTVASGSAPSTFEEESEDPPAEYAGNGDSEKGETSPEDGLSPSSPARSRADTFPL